MLWKRVLDYFLKLKQRFKRIKSIMTQNRIPELNQFVDEYGMPIPIRQSTRNNNQPKKEVDMWQRLKNPTGTIFLPEILKAVCAQQSKDDKLMMIRMWWQREPKNAELMRKFMEVLYHPKVLFNFPDSPPPYVKNDSNDFGMAPNTLFKAIRKIPLFAECDLKIANQMKRENSLIQQLETMHKDEAALFWMMIQKELDQEVYPGLTEDFFREAFSAVLPPKEVVVPVSKPIPQAPTQKSKSFEDEVKEFSETFDQNVDEIINEVTEKRGPGRPPKPKAEVGEVTEKRGPGRPPKPKQ